MKAKAIVITSILTAVSAFAAPAPYGPEFGGACLGGWLAPAAGGIAAAYIYNQESRSTGAFAAAVAITALAVPVGIGTGTFAAGEITDGPSLHPFKTWGYTTLAVTGQTFGTYILASGVGLLANSAGSEDGFAAGFILLGVGSIVTVITAPYWYNRFKEPRPAIDNDPATEGKASSLAASPFIAAGRTDDGRTVPVYGLSLSF